jgi:hypothetical protein
LNDILAVFNSNKSIEMTYEVIVRDMFKAHRLITNLNCIITDVHTNCYTEIDVKAMPQTIWIYPVRLRLSAVPTSSIRQCVRHGNIIWQYNTNCMPRGIFLPRNKSDKDDFYENLQVQCLGVVGRNSCLY